MAHKLENNYLTVSVEPFGAELSGIVCNRTLREYLWQGDPAFWKRRSPVLFPIVGSLWNGEYHYEGKPYTMSQHGFARDNRFELIRQSREEVRYNFIDNEETRMVYPFRFELQIGYKLIDNKIEVSWQVVNRGNGDMFFQIGAHPAFFYPYFNK